MKRRFVVNTGQKMVRMVEPFLEENVLTLRGDMAWDFLQGYGFVGFKPQMKRTIIRH